MTLATPGSLFAERVLLPQGWASRRILDIAGGIITAIRRGEPRDADEVASGPVVPAMANVHSHAFQRAMAGLAETSGAGEDDFWTWRAAMYGLVGRITPDDMQAIATKLYVELMRGGFGAVAEFHYLHHDTDGTPYADPAEMAHRILAAAAASGIGLTLLPVFYAHGNFGGMPPTAGQRRFIHTTDSFAALMESLQPACAAAGVGFGTAFHSLRAVGIEEMRRLFATAAEGPIHIHAAEQQREVDDSLAWSGRRPVEYLLDEMPIDARWCLIHATHMTPQETTRLAQSGAVAGLCPTTEGNLGDGLFPCTAYRALGGRFGLGTDSHVSTQAAGEIRLLEYGQRLRDQRRIRLADGLGRSVGQDLYRAAGLAGAQALGQATGQIAPGMIASLLTLDGSDPFIATAPDDAILDRWIFALGDRTVRDVMVAGRWCIRDGRHSDEAAIDRAFGAALARLNAARS